MAKLISKIFQKMDAIILAHGGAGDIPNSRVEPKVNNFARFIESVNFLTYLMFDVFVFG